MLKTRLLLVDKDIAFLRITADFLRSYGFEVLMALDSKEAITILATFPVHIAVVNYECRDVLYKTDLTIPRLVIIDLMPDIERAKAYQEIRRPIGNFDGPTLAHDLLSKMDNEVLLRNVEQVVSSHYNAQLIVSDSDAIGKLLR